MEAGYRRLMVAVLALGGVWALYLALSLTVWSTVADQRIQIVAGAVIAASLLVAYYLRTGHCTREETIALGFAYEALQVLALAFAEYASLDPGWISYQVSWSCVLILFFPLLLPSSPRTALVGSLIAASMSPLGYVLSLSVGSPSVLGTPILLSRVLPPFVCAVLVYVPARALYRLARDVKRAQRLGSYELVTRLGKGGMGEVWRARHRMLARPAAVKLIRPGVADTTRLLERFEREAQATATLESPHTVELYDFGVSDDGAFYYVMELLRGLDMNTMVTRFGPQPPERVVFLLHQACDSLDDAHRVGLIHRDIKPANLFVTFKGRRSDFVKVLDFGLVKLGPDATDLKATANGHVVGTPAFMAPETVTGKPTLDGRTDIYSLGCVAYWLLTGEMVFKAETPMAMAFAHATQEPAPPSSHAETDVPEPLEEIVMTCLSKDPTERPDARRLGEMFDACGLGETWSEERATEWWKLHVPSGPSGEQSPGNGPGQPTAVLVPA
jgi:serine/threonine-protein kinase